MYHRNKFCCCFYLLQLSMGNSSVNKENLNIFQLSFVLMSTDKPKASNTSFCNYWNPHLSDQNDKSYKSNKKIWKPRIVNSAIYQLYQMQLLFKIWNMISRIRIINLYHLFNSIETGVYILISTDSIIWK